MRRWAPIAAALSVIAVVVAVSLVFGRGSGGDPPRLRLAAGGSDTAVAADAPMATGKRAAAGTSFELVGSLPSGPDEARAQSLPRGAAKAEDVRRLAGALGITAEPRRVEKAWQVGTLRVEDVAGNPWSMYGGCGPDVPVSSDGPTTVMCASGTGVVGPGSVSSGSSGSGTSESGSSGSGSASTPNSTAVAPPPPAPAPAMSPCPDNARCAKPELLIASLPPLPSPGPTADLNAARKAAKLVLDNLGLSDADLTVDGAGEHAFVQAAPRVAGLPTSGYSTQLDVDAEGKVVGGNGYLGRPTSGASYPLISASEAFKNLPELPRPMMLCPNNADCPQPAPAKLTNAELGLQLTALANDEAALLPAWLFTIEDWPMALAQPAIEPRFLELPKPEPVDPGLVDPGPPTQIDPVPPVEPPQPVDPAGPRSAFGFDTVFPTDERNVVIVQYGDSGSCPHANVQTLVKESADTIVVTLEGDTQSTKQACTDDYRQMLVTLKLAAPLGDRKVIDGSRGEPVAVDRSCARPMGQPAAPKSCKP